MNAAPASAPAVDAFVARWQGVTASELATAQSFVIDLCALLGVDAPHATAEQDYMFERPISFHHGDGGSSLGRIDCYKRACFVLEAKKIKAGPRVGAGDTALSAKEKLIHEKGLVALLKSLHDELDAAVLDAYGWHDQPDEQTLPDQLAAVARVLSESNSAQTEAQLAANFTGKGRWKSRLPDILEALAALGRTRSTASGWVAG